MAAYVKQLLASRGKQANNEGELNGFVRYYSGTEAVQSFAHLQEEVFVKPWVEAAPKNESAPAVALQTQRVDKKAASGKRVQLKETRGTAASSTSARAAGKGIAVHPPAGKLLDQVVGSSTPKEQASTSEAAAPGTKAPSDVSSKPKALKAKAAAQRGRRHAAAAAGTPSSSVQPSPRQAKENTAPAKRNTYVAPAKRDASRSVWASKRSLTAAVPDTKQPKKALLQAEPKPVEAGDASVPADKTPDAKKAVAKNSRKNILRAKDGGKPAEVGQRDRRGLHFSLVGTNSVRENSTRPRRSAAAVMEHKEKPSEMLAPSPSPSPVPSLEYYLQKNPDLGYYLTRVKAKYARAQPTVSTTMNPILAELEGKPKLTAADVVSNFLSASFGDEDSEDLTGLGA